MYGIRFFRDSRGKEPVREYLDALAERTDKDSRIKLEKIRQYIMALRTDGTRAGKPFVKHIDGDIWELRPLRDRIFFVAWNGREFMLLHHFVKKTQKTPRKEIAVAKKRYEEAQKMERREI